MAQILDSGNRRTFDSGAVRDMQDGKGRCDLLPLEVVCGLFNDDSVIDQVTAFMTNDNTLHLYGAINYFCDQAYGGNKYTMILEVAKHFEEGAKKYGENNWQKGLPPKCYIDSALRHYFKYLRGDQDEPHDRAFVWNLMCCIWEVDHHKKEVKGLGVVYREKKDDRSCMNCKHQKSPIVINPICDDCQYYSKWDPKEGEK